MNELIKEDNIEAMIYEVRGVQVMLDSDLAKLYHCKNGTKDINKAVNRNIERFPDDFYFQLTEEEYRDLRFHIGTLNNGRGQHTKYLPYVFTEQGCAMLSSVLKTEKAAKESVVIMRAFVSMRHYLKDNQDIYKSLNNINNKLVEYDEKFKYLFDKFDYKGELIKVNKSYEAYSSIMDILNSSKREIIIVDPYADKKVLDLLKDINVSIILVTSDKSKINKIMIESFSKAHIFKMVYTNNFHDRYLIIDKKEYYLCGTSINYIGNKVSTIIKIESEVIKDYLLYEINNIIA